MFDQTFVNTDQKTKKPVTVALSVFLQICALAVLVLIPLVYTQALPSAQLRSLLTAPAPPVKATVVTKTERATITRRFSATLVAPTVIPKSINNVEELAAAPDVTIPGATSQASSAMSNAIPGVLSSIVVPPPPPPAETKPKPTQRVRVATGVAEANLIRKVMPVYPALAKSARVQGTVEFTAIISKEGTIQNLQLVRGHPLLVQAAKDAVLQWRYRPTLLNGQPVEVVTDIIVNFTLSQ
jgi:protein TonB